MQQEKLEKVQQVFRGLYGDDFLEKTPHMLKEGNTYGQMRGDELYDMLGSQKLASDKLESKGLKGIKFLDQGSRGTAGGEIIDVFEDAGKWRSKVKVTNRGGLGFTSPTDAITTSMPFDTEDAARKWAEDKIGGGTSNYVVFNPDDLEILRILGLTGAVLGTGAAVGSGTVLDDEMPDEI